MSERIVTWKALADFAKVRQEAAKTQASLAALQAQVDKNNASSIKSAGAAAAANKTQATSEQSLAEALTESNRAKEETASASQKAAVAAKQSVESTNAETSATRSAENAQTSLSGVLDKVAQARLRVAKAQQQVSSAETREAIAANTVQAAYVRLNQARSDAEAAANKVSSAESRLNDALDKHGASSDQAASASDALAAAHSRASQAASDVEKFTLRAQQAENRLQLSHLSTVGAANRLTAAERALSQAENDSGNSGNGLIGILGKLSSAFGGGGSGASAFGSALSALKLPAIAGGIYILVAAVSALASGLFALGSAVGPAVGGLAALGPLAVAAGGAFATIKLGTSGALTALKDYNTQQMAVPKSTKTAANSAISNAEAIKNAQQSLADAQANVGVVAHQSAESVANAAKQMADAQENVGIVAHQSAESIASAERQVVSAQDAELQSQKDLSAARVAAKKNIDDLKQSVIDAALAERGATLNLQDAKQNLQKVLNDPNSTRLQRQQAQLAVDEAQNQSNVAKKTSSDQQAAYQDAAKKGVEGSDQVVAAKKAEIDAVQQVKLAQQNYNDTVQQAARDNKKAVEAVAQAQQSYNDAVAQAARDNKKAQEEVARAVQSLADAQRQAAQAADDSTAAANKYNVALSKLTPAGKAFVAELERWVGLINKLKATAQNDMLPGFTIALRNMEKLFPTLNYGVSVFAKALSNLAIQASQMLTSFRWVTSLHALFSAGANITGILGKAFLNLLDAIRAISVAAIPLATNMAKATEAATKHLDAVTNAPGAYRRMTTWFEKSWTVLQKLDQILKNVATGLFNTGKAASQSGNSILSSIIAITDKWAAWTKSVEGQDKMKQFFATVRANLTIIDGAIGTVTRAFIKLGGSGTFNGILNFFKQIAPQVKEFVQSLGKSGITQQLVDIVKNLLDTLSHLAGAGGGALKAFVTVIDDFTKALDWFVKQPGAATIIKGLALAFGALAGVKLIGTVTGLGKVAEGLKSFLKLRQDAAKAQAAGDTLSFGQNLALNGADKIKSTLKDIGTAFANVGKQAVPAIKTMAAFASAKIAAGFSAIVTGVKGLGTAFMALGKVILANPWILAITAIITIVVLMVTHWQTAKKILLDIWNAIKKAAETVWNGIVDVFKTVIDWVKKNWPLLLPILLGPMGIALALIIKYWKQILEGLKVVWEAIQKAAEVVWNAIWEFFKVQILAIVAFFKLQWNLLKSFLTTLWNAIKTVASVIWTAIKVVFTTILSALSKAFTATWNGIKDFLTGAWNAFKSVASGIWHSISGAISSAFGSVLGALQNSWRAISGWFSTAWKAFGTWVSNIWKSISGAISGAFGGVENALSNVWHGIEKVFTDAINWVTQSVLNRFIGAINTVIGVFGVKIKTIPKIGGSPPTPKLLSGVASGNTTHGFAKGGVLPGYSPGQDIHKFVSPTGGEIHLSGGEGILVPEAVRALGGARGIQTINSTYSNRVQRPADGSHFSSGGIFGGVGSAVKTAAGDITGALGSLGAWLTKNGLNLAEKPLMAIIDHMPFPKFFKEMSHNVVDTIGNGVSNWIKKKTAAPTVNGSYGGATGSSALHNVWLAEAFAAAGIPATAANMDAVNIIVQNESGWNPNAINLTDSNAQAGHPSQGLMQTIPSTFDAYRLPNLAGGITDPVANLVAGMRYAISRYGSLENVPGVRSVHSGGAYVGYRNGGVIPVQMFHEGGIVKGIGPGGNNMSNAALAFQSLDRVPINGLWPSTLSNTLKKRMAGVNDHTDVINTSEPPRAYANMPYNSPHIPIFMNWLNTRKPRSYSQIVSEYAHGNTYFPIQAYLSNTEAWSRARWHAGYNPIPLLQKEIAMDASWVNKYRSDMGLPTKPGVLWTNEMDAPSDHIIAHALGQAHPADWPHPWAGDISTAESAIADSDRANALNTEFYNDLQILTNWGLPDLVDDLMSKGVADGLQIARDAVKNKAVATQLNASLHAGKQGYGGLSTDDQNTVLKIIAKIASGTAQHPFGLRDVAGMLQVQEYSVVNLYDKMTDQLAKIPETLKAKFENDVSLFRQGLFYANTGAIVPGSGNQDTVPAMLTPGEGVLQKKAMAWLGHDNFHRLNNGELPHFATGGIVLAPNVPSTPHIPAAATAGPSVSSDVYRESRGGDNITYEYNTEINNPTGENSVYSMNKNLQRIRYRATPPKD